MGHIPDMVHVSLKTGLILWTIWSTTLESDLNISHEISHTSFDTKMQSFWLAVASSIIVLG